VRTKARTGADGSLDRTAYFNAAFKILAEGGAEALTIPNLCTRLGVTKGSFYHHFSGADEFVSALMRCWIETARLVIDEMLAKFAADDDPYLSFGVALSNIAAGQPHEAEAALRAWAHSNPEVAAGVEQYDRLRDEAGIPNDVYLGALDASAVAVPLPIEGQDRDGATACHAADRLEVELRAGPPLVVRR
jgi:AcrR family transcriptional regulator